VPVNEIDLEGVIKGETGVSEAIVVECEFKEEVEVILLCAGGTSASSNPNP
jgi:hypothetical protein